MLKRLVLLPAGLGISGMAAAHTGHAVGGGFLTGLVHPLLGWDHVLAAFAVGLLASRVEAKRAWLLPVLFVGVMLAGVGYAELGVTLLQPEWLIIASLVVFGTMLFFDSTPLQWAAMCLVGLFALFHGYLHGSEMPLAISPTGYLFGLMTATLAVHIGGLAVGRISSPVMMKMYGLLIGTVGFSAVFG